VRGVVRRSGEITQKVVPVVFEAAPGRALSRKRSTENVGLGLPCGTANRGVGFKRRRAVLRALAGFPGIAEVDATEKCK